MSERSELIMSTVFVSPRSGEMLTGAPRPAPTVAITYHLEVHQWV